MPVATPLQPTTPPSAELKPGANSSQAINSVPARDLSHSPHEIPTLVRVDPFTPANTQPNIHTRWHPDIPACAEIELGMAFKVECMDYSGTFLEDWKGWD